MNIEEQKQHFLDLWSKNASDFGVQRTAKEPDYMYYVEVPLDAEIAAATRETANMRFKDVLGSETKEIPADQLSITVVLPGRLGSHFQKNDLSYLKKTLQNITKQTPIFEIELGNFNAFPNTIFREILDESGRLRQLHDTLCQEIPFSQHPDFRQTYFVPHASVFYGGNKTDLTNLERSVDPIIMPVKQLVLGRIESDFSKKPLHSFQLCES